MAWWIALIILGIALLYFWADRNNEKYSDPLGDTESSHETSKFENEALNKRYASEINPKSKKKASKKKRSVKGG